MDNRIIEGKDFCGALPVDSHGTCLTLYGAIEGTVILVLPGGGYGKMASEREGHPVAQAFQRASFGGAVLEYTLFPRPWNLPLLETMGAIAYLKAQGASKVVVCGFSAGGHLAACAGNLWRNTDLCGELGLTSQQVRPDALILAYPVISGQEPIKNVMTYNNLLGEGVEVPPYLSLQNGIQSDNPPAFVWATVNDNAVPVEHSLTYVTALQEAKVPFELHLYPNGPHAMALATAETEGHPEQQDPHVATWFDLCAQWLQLL